MPRTKEEIMGNLYAEVVNGIGRDMDFVALVDEYAQAYANERFEKARVKEEKNIDDLYDVGWNGCRETWIDNWNAQSKE